MPTLSKTVQARDIEQVLSYYTNRDVPAFAIMCGKQLMFSYSGDDIQEGETLLTEMLTMLTNAQSAGIYTLCVYEDLTGKITNVTPYNGSINFRFMEQPQNYLPPAEYGKYNEMKTELGQLKAQMNEIKELLEGDEEEESPQDQLGRIKGLLELPAVQSIVGMITNLINRRTMNPGQQTASNLGRMSGTDSDEVMKEIEQQLPKVKEALKTILPKVPDFADLLLAFANLSDNNPVVFQSAIGSLRGLLQ